MADSLEERLKSHAKAFDGLLSLIPAKLYYADDTSDQWQKKKQTKEEARQAKLAKLDPDAAKSAKDVLDERARKRKRDEDEDGAGLDPRPAVEVEQPKQGLKPVTKKQKKHIERAPEKNDGPGADVPSTAQDKADKNRAKRERKRARQAAKAEKKQRQRARKEETTSTTKDVDETMGDVEFDPNAASTSEIPVPSAPADTIASTTATADETADTPRSSTPRSAEPDSPMFDGSAAQSATSSTSSIIPPTTRPKLEMSPADAEALRLRLQARIEVLRASRKADGLNGAPARNRQELLEARRKKEDERRALKKELRLKAKEQEKEARERALIANSPDVGSPLRITPAASDNYFSFGKVAFSDGQQLSADLSTLLDPRKIKGPQDPLGALKASDNKRARLAGLDEGKRKDIEEKDAWLNARKRAHGERIRDDSSLLKKTLKRKEKVKQKSATEWNERLDGVQKSQEARQRKREDNLQKRREEKGGKKGKKVGKKTKPKPKPKSKNRPGFEGSLRGKASPGRK
ncbi:MAG: hypothetical protein M1838_000700 [Thelocarpon superellum]|nr:MAG: hypothetical protein M1838_000700 [Thelocarpon superellum]